jgi:putative SOS response-associated peptidase YedK
MCGRFLTPDEAAFERHWGLTAPPDYFPSFNMAPSQLAAIVRLDERSERIVELQTWGFQPSWAKRAWINARSETAFESKAFSRAARAARCLVPAIGWYEWQGSEAPKQPYVFHLDGFSPFAFAGIWTARETDGGSSRSFAILTGPAARELCAIHDRMPLIMSPEHYAAWLDPDTPAEKAKRLATSAHPSLKTYAVSTYVNKPANNDAECIRPLEA